MKSTQVICHGGFEKPQQVMLNARLVQSKMIPTAHEQVLWSRNAEWLYVLNAFQPSFIYVLAHIILIVDA